MKRKRFIMFLSLAIMINALLLIPVINPPAISADVIKLKVANYFPPPSMQSKIMAEFISELEMRTDGRVKVQYFPGGSLLKAPATIKGVDSGIADIGLAHIEYTAGRFPVMEACEMPIGYSSGWVANQIMNDFYNKFKPKEFDNYKVLWFHANSPSMIITKKPVRKLEDMKGLTIRAPGRFGDVITALGGTPAPTPIMETYDAISKGVIDGVFVPYETLRTFKFAEVAKYVTNTGFIGPCYPFYVAMNKKSYGKLPPDIKEILDTLSGEFKERMALMWNGVEFPGKAFGKEMGVEFIDLSEEEAARWVKAVVQVTENYIKDMVSKGYKESEVRGWFEFIKERRAVLTEKQKFYQINAP
ncbi:TRAP transporter substrate-binding protein [Thermodesulfobacteriota bacterium]